MARGLHGTLDSFHCNSCDVRLGWTAAGEAKRMNTRARVFCDLCKDSPGGLTARMEEILDALRALRDSGSRASVSQAAKDMGISVSRAQQIVTAIRARGQGNLVDEAMGKEPVAVARAAHPEAPIDWSPGPRPSREPEPTAAAARFANPDGSAAPSPLFHDPASYGNNEFV